LNLLPRRFDRNVKENAQMPRCQFEPTLEDALADPVVQAVMAADGVDPAALADCLGKIAERIRRGTETE
jgi:hypothetical protein